MVEVFEKLLLLKEFEIVMPINETVLLNIKQLLELQTEKRVDLESLISFIKSKVMIFFIQL
jgi:hypothetical protein